MIALNPDEIVRILAEEYGIIGEQALNNAIQKQQFIDITPFCVLPMKAKEERNCDKE